MPSGTAPIRLRPERARDRRRLLPTTASRPGAIAPAPLLLQMQRTLGNQAQGL
jgi:hypothetical protein